MDNVYKNAIKRIKTVASELNLNESLPEKTILDRLKIPDK